MSPGKTALLKALHKFNPASNEPYNPQKEFPRDRYTRDYVSRRDQAGKWPVCSVEFEIPGTIKAKLVDEDRPSDHLPERVIATRYYDGTLDLEYEPTIPDESVSPQSVIEALKNLCSKRSETCNTGRRKTTTKPLTSVLTLLNGPGTGKAI